MLEWPDIAQYFTLIAPFHSWKGWIKLTSLRFMDCPQNFEPKQTLFLMAENISPNVLKHIIRIFNNSNWLKYRNIKNCNIKSTRKWNIGLTTIWSEQCNGSKKCIHNHFPTRVKVEPEISKEYSKKIQNKKSNTYHQFRQRNLNLWQHNFTIISPSKINLQREVRLQNIKYVLLK